MPNRIAVDSNRPWFKSWPRLMPKSLDYPEVPLFESMKTTAGRYPDKPAVIYYGREVSYRELWKSILKFATWLKETGIGKGDRVTIHLPNSPQFVIAFYGILRANAIVVATDPMLSAEGLKALLNDNGSKAIVTMASSLPMVNEIRGATSLEQVIATEFTDYLPESPSLPVPPPPAETRRNRSARTELGGDP
jgi:acyl-CoA synthetase (AMP-forming)/AMP-acid ligase II